MNAVLNFKLHFGSLCFDAGERRHRCPVAHIASLEQRGSSTK